MTTAAWLLLVATLILSLAGFGVQLVMGSRTLVQTASAQLVANLQSELQLEQGKREELEIRVADCERGRADLITRVAGLEREELDLRRKLDALEA